MKKKLIAVGLAGLMSVSAVFTAFADPVTVSDGGVDNYDNGTDIYAGVILDDPDAKIRVNVPTLFAFVVNGSVAENNDAITVENEALLLPNVKVSVTDPTSDTSDYQVQVVSDGAMYFENFSTAKEGTGRKGIDVTIKGSIENQGEAISRNYWEHVGAKPGTDEADFKKYRLLVEDVPFETSAGTGIFEMSSAVDLAAPDASEANIDKNTNFAINGSKKYVNFNVEVGGTRGMYKQVEESAKVGTIVWTVGYDVENSTNPTAPKNDPQETAPTTQP